MPRDKMNIIESDKKTLSGRFYWKGLPEFKLTIRLKSSYQKITY